MFFILKQNKRTKNNIDNLLKLDANLTVKHYDYVASVTSVGKTLISYIDCDKRVLRVWRATEDHSAKDILEIPLRDFITIYDL